MDNLAPAISPPSGIGDSKPSNQAVLDWVQEVARLTEPENIFWCDGSEKENDYLLGEAQRQGVVIKLNEEKIPAPICIARIRTTSRASSNSPSSARRRKRKPARPTTGPRPPRFTQSSTACSQGAMRGRTMFVVPYLMGPPVRR